MAEWALKRFWKAAEVAETDGGFTVHLDGRPLRTPAKAPLVMPTRAMAEAAAAEWDAQEAEVRPLTMPVTRAANAAIDRVRTHRAEVAALIAAYGESDLLCHRADSPAELVAWQEAAWGPLLAWARDALEAPLVVTSGVIPCPQPADALSALQARVAARDEFELTALHNLVGLSGSLVIGFAAMEDAVAPIEELWDLSRLDETWQERQWGVDDEAAAAAARKKEDFLQARRFADLARRSA